MSEGRFEHAGLGTVLHRIEMYTDITDQAVNLTEFTAFGRTGGSLSGTGSFSLSGSGQSSISVQADQLVIAERREGRAVTSGTFGLELRDEVMLINKELLAFGPVETTFTQENLAKAFGGMLRHHQLIGADLHDDEDARGITVLTDDERPLVFYGEHGGQKITKHGGQND